MLRRLVLLSVLIPTLTVAVVSRAIAQSTQTCTFTQPTPGELIADSKALPTKLLSSSAAGGSPTQISITCNQSINLIVSDPIQIAGPAFTPVSSLATVETPSNGSTNSRGGSPLALPVGTTTLNINLSVDKGSPLAPGNYRYGVKFTIIP